MTAPVVVFLGPSLPLAEARALLDADYRPPARMGDVYGALREGVAGIILLDGVFHGAPSVWHREIMDALDEGVRVVGASSMGALRAAELHVFGMVGRGTVFEWFRDGVIDGDDEVALLHAPAEDGYLALSEPLVNMRATAARAAAEGLVSAAEAAALVDAAKALHYPERSWERLLEDGPCAAWPAARREALRAQVTRRAVDVKREDARGALLGWAGEHARSRPERAPLPPKSVFWEMGRLLWTRFPARAGTVTGQRLLDVVRADPEASRALWDTLSRRRFVVEWARQNGVACPPGWAEERARAWQERHRVDEAWLRANGLMRASARAALAEEALAAWAAREHGEEARVRAWAEHNGVSGPPGEPDLARWVVDQGPDFFGIGWSFDAALLRELQVTGRAAQIAGALDGD